jgi:CpeS-like protein
MQSRDIQKSMDIREFFQQSSGKWSSIKSSHHVDNTTQQSGKSTIEMALLEPSEAAVVALCEKQGVNPQTVLCGARVQWDGFIEGETKNQKGSLLMVAAGDAMAGTLYRSMGNFGIAVPASQFSFAEGQEITLTTTADNLTTVERIWFESENVRLRHTKTHRPDGSSTIAFCSEVRLGVTKPAE